MAYRITTSLALGSGQTGLTLKAQLVNTAGANVGAEITTGFVEVGLGNYLWDYASVPDGHRGGVKFLKSGDTLMAFGAIAPEDAEDIAIIRETVDELGEAADPLANQVPGAYESGTAGAALGRIGVGLIKVVNPLTPGGDLYLIRGDAYLAEDGRAIDFTDADSAVKWPALTDFDEVVLVLQGSEIAGEIVAPTGASKLVRFELEIDDTTGLSTDESRYAVRVRKSGSPEPEDVVTLVRGRLIVREATE